MAEPTPMLTGWERALMAAEKVKERLRRAVKALEGSGVDYSIVGGNAVSEWIARVDEDAVRNTKDVDILIVRADFQSVRNALEGAGFLYHQLMDIDVFIDGPQGRPSGGIHLLYAGEKVKKDDLTPCPSIRDSERALGIDAGAQFQVVTLEALVRMKLTSWRRKDQVHLLDLIHVGQIDQSWPARFPPPLAARLQELIDNPDS